MNKLIKLINNGWDIKIYSHIKRMEVKGIRGFHLRVCWRVRKDDGFEEEIIECEWEGFTTPKEAINDMFDKLLTK